MHIVRGILILTLLIGAFFVGGPFIGVIVFSSTVAIPILFIATLLFLAIWKIRELTRRQPAAGQAQPCQQQPGQQT